ncbi:MAG: imidazole glycerol phosphate synthase subunit HisH [Acidimicrobiales bacterium]
MTGLRIAVLDYGIGNLRSAQKALEHLGAEAALTADREIIEAADGVVLPGVGAFGACVDAMAATGVDQLAKDAAASGRPFLGICVGMQLLFEGSTESPDHAGLGILPGRITRLPDTVKVPQMQWNQLETTQPHPLVAGLDGSWMYFVHSFGALETDLAIATCNYGVSIAAAVAKDNVWATQFHPEKSARAGQRLLQNWLDDVHANAKERAS